MSRIPDDLPAGPAGSSNLVRALSSARTLPADAIARAARRPDRIRAEVVSALREAAAGIPLDPAGENLAFWGVHALAQARDAAVYRPLLRVLRLDDDDLEQIFGDAVTGTLPRIVASVFDGDADPLEAAILDPATEDFARYSLFQALTFLAAEARLPRDRAAATLRRFEAERVARAGAACWGGWEEAVALLGLSELGPTVEAARQDGRLLDDINGRDWFETALARAAADPGDRRDFHPHAFGYVDDAAAELDRMFRSIEGEPDPIAPVQNPLRAVGRNDPCPCGSGKKFKKCCLAA